MTERSWSPDSCPRCGEHRLIVTRVRCADCGLEMAADDLGHLCAHDSATGPGGRAETQNPPASSVPGPDPAPASVGASGAEDGVRTQILDAVAAGRLDPAVAAGLLAERGRES
ncbi:hypothetical protein [Nigerium massiliense]|uniref:hypothetical protein n=1 Tax=Nigerium massiliense TaxID=1522317 RepID=UPI00058C7D89|nr:hypothetical protein [Nigerium massiliense]